MKQDKYEIVKLCEMCEHATPIEITQNILCDKKGIVACDYVCHSFSYDPLKRKPVVLPIPSLEYIPLDDEIKEEVSDSLENSNISSVLEKVDLDESLENKDELVFDANFNKEEIKNEIPEELGDGGQK